MIFWAEPLAEIPRLCKEMRLFGRSLEIPHYDTTFSSVRLDQLAHTHLEDYRTLSCQVTGGLIA